MTCARIFGTLLQTFKNTRVIHNVNFYLLQELKYEQTWTVHNLRIFIIVYSFSITLEVSFRGRSSISSTVHFSVPYRSHNCRTRALTLRLCFCCLKENWFHGYKTGSIPFGAWRPIQIYSGYTSIPLPDVCIFNSNLNPACFMHHFPVLTCIFEFTINTAPPALNSVYDTVKCLAYHRINPGKSALGTRLKINASKLTWVALWCSGQGVACTCRWTGFDFRRRSFLFLCTVFLFFLFSQFVF